MEYPGRRIPRRPEPAPVPSTRTAPEPEVVQQPDEDAHMHTDLSDELDVMSEEEL